MSPNNLIITMLIVILMICRLTPDGRWLTGCDEPAVKRRSLGSSLTPGFYYATVKKLDWHIMRKTVLVGCIRTQGYFAGYNEAGTIPYKLANYDRSVSCDGGRSLPRQIPRPRSQMWNQFVGMGKSLTRHLVHQKVLLGCTFRYVDTPFKVDVVGAKQCSNNERTNAFTKIEYT
jgi:hypothetical protein